MAETRIPLMKLVRKMVATVPVHFQLARSCLGWGDAAWASGAVRSFSSGTDMLERSPSCEQPEPVESFGADGRASKSVMVGAGCDLRDGIQSTISAVVQQSRQFRHTKRWPPTLEYSTETRKRGR
jgi:hypothetical protein